MVQRFGWCLAVMVSLALSPLLFAGEAPMPHRGQGIAWFEGSIPDALSAAYDRQTLTMIYFFAEESEASRRMGEDTLLDKRGVEVLNGFVCLRINAQSAGAEVAAQYSVSDFPTALFLLSDGKEAGRIVGYRDPGRFLAYVSLIEEAAKGPAEEPLISAPAEEYPSGESEEPIEPGEEITSEEEEAAVPEAEVAPLQRRPENLQERKEPVPEKPQENPAQTLYEEGIELLKQGKGDEALANFQKVKAQDPKNQTGFADRARFQVLGIQIHDTIVKFDRFRKAVRGEVVRQPLTEVVSDEVRPKFSHPYIDGLLSQAGEVAAPFLVPGSAVNGEDEEEAAIEMEELRDLLFHTLAAEFEQFLKENPTSAMKKDVYLNLQTLYFKVADVEKGVEVSEELLKLDSTDPLSLARYARFLAANDARLDRARELAEKAHDFQPKSVETLDTLALVEFKLGNIGRAVELEEKALELAPEASVLRKRLETYRKALASGEPE